MYIVYPLLLLAARLCVKSCQCRRPPCCAMDAAGLPIRKYHEYKYGLNKMRFVEDNVVAYSGKFDRSITLFIDLLMKLPIEVLNDVLKYLLIEVPISVD